jgi:hypothetical protein
MYTDNEFVVPHLPAPIQRLHYLHVTTNFQLFYFKLQIYTLFMWRVVCEFAMYVLVWYGTYNVQYTPSPREFGSSIHGFQMHIQIVYMYEYMFVVVCVCVAGCVCSIFV